MIWAVSIIMCATRLTGSCFLESAVIEITAVCCNMTALGLLWIEMEMSCLTSNKISRDIKTPPHMKETEVPRHLRGFMLIKLGYHLLPETFNNNTHHFCFLPQFHSTIYHSYCMWILASFFFLPPYFITVIVVIQKLIYIATFQVLDYLTTKHSGLNATQTV